MVGERRLDYVVNFLNEAATEKVLKKLEMIASESRPHQKSVDRGLEAVGVIVKPVYARLPVSVSHVPQSPNVPWVLKPASN